MDSGLRCQLLCVCKMCRLDAKFAFKLPKKGNFFNSKSEDKVIHLGELLLYSTLIHVERIDSPKIHFSLALSSKEASKTSSIQKRIIKILEASKTSKVVI